ncbi:YihY/virulence factor BrkB family protein [Allokutzneria sp. A3M-2-11 16]|uniref:YhjD/YihY/BrkB family envelope integrity protein n=1 Tax=Allokutzneria sp. A3M-2-11 16 TaxID=2962043 RepID=UPI0020B8CD2E|nr:YhjD/YihY/BrkB family envelope integrity protein [Allokutzneria sp. A3M-2-11 16]MCP3800375.1 YihY/virulence factor BrkB family protein [Allokutzneria sp. A3M-2-11 16]
MAEQAKPSWFERKRKQHRWFDHLIRSGGRYMDNYGDHYAAAITYFSILAIVPLLMVAFSVAGVILEGDAVLLAQFKAEIVAALPRGADSSVDGILNTVLAERRTVGYFGFVVALYSGYSWMVSLRDALTAQWGLARPELPFLRTILKDLLALVSLGVALLISIGITVAGSGMAETVLGWVGLADQGWAQASIRALSIVLSLGANWLVFLWVLAKLPRKPVTWRSAMRGAIFGAIGFELLKQAGALYLSQVTKSTTGAVFGSILGLFIFVNLVARLLVFSAAWTATARDNAPAPVEKATPAPAVIQPIVEVHGRPSPRAAVGLLGVGLLLGRLLRFRRTGR